MDEVDKVVNKKNEERSNKIIIFYKYVIIGFN